MTQNIERIRELAAEYSAGRSVEGIYPETEEVIRLMDRLPEVAREAEALGAVVDYNGVHLPPDTPGHCGDCRYWKESLCPRLMYAIGQCRLAPGSVETHRNDGCGEFQARRQ